MGEHWKHQCASDAIYSISEQCCVYRATGLPVEGSVNNLNFGMYDYVSEFTLTIDSVGTGFYQVARFLCLASIYYILVYLYIVLLASIISQFICILFC